MADKQLGITITGDVDDILAKLEEVTGKIQDVPDRTIDLGINVNDNGLDTFKTSLDGITDQTVTVNVDDSGLLQLTSTADEAVNHIEAIGDASANVSTDISGNFGDASVANNSILSLGTSAKEATGDISDAGQAGESSANQISDNMNEAVIAIAAVAAVAEVSAEKIYDMGQASYQLATYTGMSDDEIKSMETSLSRASFPIESVDSYLETLMQLDVPNSLLKDNAAALNEIVLGTGSAASEGTAFAKSIKVLGGDVSNLTDYYGMAGYAQQNVVGGLEAFDSIAKTLGPKLKEMGLTSEQSAVVIASLSQKYGGNVRMMRKAITDADGDVNKLYGTLGLTKDQVDDTTETFDSYANKLIQTAEASKKAHTATEEAQVQIADWGLYAGKAASDILSLIAVIGGGWGLIGVLAKAKDLLYDSKTATTWWKETTKSAFKGVGDIYKWIGSTISDTIKSWMAWGDSASEASENVATKMLEKSAGVGDAGETVGKAAGEGFRKGASESATLIDEAGNVLWRDTDNVIGRVSSQSIKAEEAGSLIPKGIGDGILKSIPKLIGDIALPLTVIQLGIDAIYNYNEDLNKNPIELGLDMYLGPWTDLIPQQIKDFNQQIFGSLSPMNLAKTLFGGANVDSFVGMMNSNIVNPVKGGLDSLWDTIKSPPKLAAIPGDIYNSLSGVPGAISGALANAPSAFDNATNQIAYNSGLAIGTLYKFPGRAYTALLPTGQNMYNALVNAPAYLQGAWGNTALWFTNLPGTLYGYGVNAWNGLTNGFNSTYANVVGAVNNVPNTINGTIAWIGGLPGTLYQYGANAWNGLAGGFNSSVGNVQGSVNSLTGSIQSGINWIINLPGNMYNWGKSIIDSFVQGLGDSLTGAKDWINKKLGWLLAGAKAASPPKEGPLQNIDIWGESIGGTFAEGVASGLSSSKDLLSTSLGANFGFNNMATSTPLPSAASVSNIGSVGGAVIYFTGDIIVPEGSDAVAVGRDLGTGIHESLSERLSNQGNSRGVSYVNLNR